MKELSIEDKQRISLDILLDFKHVCETNNLKYYLFYGTLIGAVRHNGFIPWDDDVDVVMPRPDFEKLCQIYENNQRYKLYSYRTEKTYVLPYMKLCDTKTYAVLADGSKCMRGIGIDIFALVGQEDNFDVENERYNKRKAFFLKWLFSIESIMHLGDDRKIKGRIKRSIANIMRDTGCAHSMVKQLDRSIGRLDYNTSTYVAVQELYSDKYIRWKKIQFGEGAKLKFENEYFTVPSDYIRILESTYGDFMTLPPVEDRQTTHFEKYYVQ